MEEMTLAAPPIVMGPSAGVTQIPATPPPPAEPTYRPENMAADLELIRRELEGQAVTQSTPQGSPETPEPAPEPAQPQGDQPPAAAATPAPVQVPDKFKNSDGTVNLEKVTKSYLEAERELKRAQNAARAPQPAPTQQPTVPPATAPQTPPLSPFAAQLEAEAKQYGLGTVLEKMAYALEESAYRRSMADIEQIKQAQDERARTEELQAIGKLDPRVFTEDGFKTLTEIRKNNPWINASPEPWKNAYKHYLADQALKQMTSGGTQVQTPTPKPVTAPPAPVNGGVRPATQSAPKDEAAVLAYIEKHKQHLSFEDEGRLWRSIGKYWPTQQQVGRP